MKLVLVESPWRSQSLDEHLLNLEYAKLCGLDSVQRGETPMLGHLLYTQFLDDKDPGQRAIGIKCHLNWLSVAHLVAVYHDFGVSEGMQLAIDTAKGLGVAITRRRLVD